MKPKNEVKSTAALVSCYYPKMFVCILTVCPCGCRILQYGYMSMSSEASEGTQIITKAKQAAKGEQGLLNLLAEDTVFYVGGYPETFRVSAACVMQRS